MGTNCVAAKVAQHRGHWGKQSVNRTLQPSRTPMALNAHRRPLGYFLRVRLDIRSSTAPITWRNAATSL